MTNNSFLPQQEQWCYVMNKSHLSLQNRIISQVRDFILRLTQSQNDLYVCWNMSTPKHWEAAEQTDWQKPSPTLHNPESLVCLSTYVRPRVFWESDQKKPASGRRSTAVLNQRKFRQLHLSLFAHFSLFCDGRHSAEQNYDVLVRRQMPYPTGWQAPNQSSSNPI